MNPEVDTFLERAKKWREEMGALRSILLMTPLTEDLKWRMPCYTLGNKNVVMIAGFKDYCALSFFKGALLKDPKGILRKPGENTQSGRVIRFTSVQEINQLTPAIEAYLSEAIDIEKAGLKVDAPKERTLDYPEELQTLLNADPALNTAFEGLTPGRKRAYIMHIAAAKQSKTRIARIEKYVPRILDGKGMHDCTCGLSKRMPSCDGSHKQLQQQ